MQIVVDGLLTQYRRSGKTGQPSIVIVHGWGDSSKGWRNFEEQFAGHYDLVIVDLPGFGATDAPPQAWGLDEYAGFVGHFLAKLDVSPYAIIGHSNGGAIVVRGLAQGSMRAERLVLIASAGIRGQYKGRNYALRLLTKAGKAIVTPLPSSVKQRLRRKLYTTVGSDMLVAEHLQTSFKKIVSDDIQADAARLDLPTLLIYGENDVSTPPAFGRMLHEDIRGSSLEIIGGAGHFVHLDKPDIVKSQIEEFLR